MTNVTTLTQYQWLDRLQQMLPNYLNSLQLADQPGHFLPCIKGVTEVGSCFGLKLYYMLGLWQTLELQSQEAWIAFLKSFQVDSYAQVKSVTHNAFVDPPVIEYLAAQIPWYQRFAKRIFPGKEMTYVQQVIIAETKQAIATLAQIGAACTTLCRFSNGACRC